MRITNQIINKNGMDNISANMERLYNYQTQAATGKAYQNASDNPAVAAEGMAVRSAQRAMTSYIDTANSTSDWMNASDYALQQMADVSKQAVALIAKGLTDTNGPNERLAVGVQLNGMINQMLNFANTQHVGKYIFAGFQVNTQPFQTTIVNDPQMGQVVSTVTYAGDAGLMQRDVGPNEQTTANVIANTELTNVLQVMITARDAMATNNLAVLHSTVSPMLDNIQNASDDVAELTTNLGARMNVLESSVDRMKQANVDLTALLSSKEEVNMAEVLSNLKNQETVYQATLQVSARMNNMMNLFDALR
jgi:flagellar hook-associated protein 3 FlgL